MSSVATPGITVRVLCFAQLRDRLGGSEFACTVPVGATGRELIYALVERNPAIGPLLNVSRLAVNAEYVQFDAVLHDGDEVAVIPPVSGG